LETPSLVASEATWLCKSLGMQRTAGSVKGRSNCRFHDRRLSTWFLASLVFACAFLFGESAYADPSQATLARVGSSLGPYTNVNWKLLTYPGLTDCFVVPSSIRPSDSVVIEKGETLTVSGRSEPVALVVASCNLNQTYASLYVFGPGTEVGHPELLQRLSL
jgi:hypothetical protein